jgi:hypothetical protein
MKDNSKQIRRYDDSLLKYERATRVFYGLVISLFMLFLAWVLIMAPSGFFIDRMNIISSVFIIFIILYSALSSTLHHIASIKLYRKEIKESQQQPAPYFK